jgi:hypothetical protein
MTFNGAGSLLGSEFWRSSLGRVRSVVLAELLLACRGEKLPGALGVGLDGCMGVGIGVRVKESSLSHLGSAGLGIATLDPLSRPCCDSGHDGTLVVSLKALD